jgi:hypothetical protein
MKKYLIFLIALSFSSNVMAAYLLEEAALGARRVAHLWKAPATLATIPRTSSALLSRSFFSGAFVQDFTLMGKPVSTFPVFSFRGFSSLASKAFEPETAKLQVVKQRDIINEYYRRAERRARWVHTISESEKDVELESTKKPHRDTLDDYYKRAERRITNCIPTVSEAGKKHPLF